MLGELVSKRRDVPHFTTLAGQDVRTSNDWHLRWLRPGREKRLVALSAFQQRVFRQTTGLEAGHRIPWGIDIDDTPGFIAGDRPIDVLGVGSLVPVKHWEKWLRVLAAVADARPQLRAVLIGEGSEHGRLRQLAAQLGLTARVHFAGALPRQEVLATMGRAKILLHTASFESFGFVYPEAAAQGCALVSTPVGVAPEMGADCAESESALASLLLRRLTAGRPPFPTRPFVAKDTAARYMALWKAGWPST